MNLIAVSQRVDYIPARKEFRDSLDVRISRFLSKVGLLAVPVPNCLTDRGDEYRGLSLWLDSVSPRGVLLSGGNDLGEFASRDITEGYLVDYARTKQLPLLGICRGMQMLAKLDGIGLKRVQGHVGTKHQISGCFEREVNSFHEYSINSVPPDYKVTALAPDGEIEAIRHKFLPWEGWMWHPEREEFYQESDLESVGKLFA